MREYLKKTLRQNVKIKENNARYNTTRHYSLYKCNWLPFYRPFSFAPQPFDCFADTVSVELYSYLVCQQVDFSKNQLVGTLVYSQTHYIYYIFHFLLLFTINISCTDVYLLLFTPFSVTFICFVNPNNDLPLSIVRSVKH